MKHVYIETLWKVFDGNYSVLRWEYVGDNWSDVNIDKFHRKFEKIDYEGEVENFIDGIHTEDDLHLVFEKLLAI
jgi:hypothetical protein